MVSLAYCIAINLFAIALVSSFTFEPSAEEKAAWSKIVIENGAVLNETMQSAAFGHGMSVSGGAAACVDQMIIIANDIGCGSGGGCKVFIHDPGHVSDAEWCSQQGSSVYERKCDPLPISNEGLVRDVVVMRGNGNHPRSLHVSVDAWNPNQQSLTVTLKVFEGLPNVQPDRTKTSTIFRHECAQIAPAASYGLFKVCNACSYSASPRPKSWLEMYDSRDCSGSPVEIVDLTSSTESRCEKCWDRCAHNNDGYPSYRLRGPGKAVIAWNCIGKYSYSSAGFARGGVFTEASGCHAPGGGGTVVLCDGQVDEVLKTEFHEQCSHRRLSESTPEEWMPGMQVRTFYP